MAWAAFFEVSQPELAAHWQQLLSTLAYIRFLLRDDPDFWSMSGVVAGTIGVAPGLAGSAGPGLAHALCPPLESVPTLTLAYDFPLPAYRQPGRLRRLRRQARSGSAAGGPCRLWGERR